MPNLIGLPIAGGGKPAPPDNKIRVGGADLAWAAAVPTIPKTVLIPSASTIAISASAPTVTTPSGFDLRDQYTTAINPLVDGAAEPGPGTRDVTGSLWKIISGRLRGGMQPSAPAWGSSKIVYDGQTRADGLTLWTVVNAANKDADLGVGWASSTSVTDPTTNGHHWLMREGYGRLSQPGKEVTLVGLNAGDVGQFRATEYLVGVTLRAQGAFYWISGIAPITGPTTYTSDYIGIPQYPSARVLWVEDTTTTTPMYPHITALDLLSHADGHAIEDLRVDVISDWATDAGLATFMDRFTRADSATSVGAGWTNVAGTGGISSNQAYLPTPSGSRSFIIRSGAASSGDGIWCWKVTVGASTSNILECYFRYVNTTNYCRVQFSGGSVWLYDVVGGTENLVANYPFSLSAGQNIDILVTTIGNRYQLFLDDVLKINWGVGVSGATMTGTGMGFGGWALSGTTARWDDFMWCPHTVTLPAGIQSGTAPSIFTPGSTIMDDTFSGSNGAAINGRTPDTTGAGTWTTNMNGANGSWTVQSNAARDGSTTGGPMTFAYYDAASPDVEATLNYITDASGAVAAGVLLRFTDTTHWVGARVLGNIGGTDNEIEILEANGDSGPIVKFQQIGGFHVASTAYTMKVQIVGDVMHVFLAGIPIISYIVHVPNSNRHGLLNSVGAAMSFDRITIKALT